MKRTLAVMLLVLVSALLSGCWDKREINDLAVVVGLSIDLEEGAGGEQEVRLTFQVANPSAILPAGAGGGGGGGGGTRAAKAYWTVSAKGRTVRAAALKINYRVPKQLFFGHVRAHVIGEKMARSGVTPILDRTLRSSETRENTFIAVTKGEGKRVIEQETPVFRTSALALNDMFTLKNGTQAIMAVTLSDFFYRLNTRTTCPVAPLVEVGPQASLTSEEKAAGSSKETIVVNGIGVFNPDGKLVDFLDERETLGLMWVLNKVRSREITVSFPELGPDARITLGVIRSKSSIAVKIGEDGLPGFEINVTTLCDLWEHQGHYAGMLDSKFLENVEKAASGQILNEIEAAVRKAQTLNCDIFGFGEEVRRQHSREWYQMKDRWKGIFPSVNVTVSSETSLRHRGLTVESPGTPEEATKPRGTYKGERE